MAEGDEVGRRVVVGVWQGRARPGDLPGNLAEVCRRVKAAKSRGVELLLFPELFLCGYDCIREQLEGGAAVELASSPEMAAISDLARAEGVAVALPYAERHEGRLYNSCALFDCRGDLVLNYRKVNLWGPWEQSVFARSQPGGLRAVDLRLQSGASLRLGILICYDVEFPEPSRCLAVQGAELLLVPTALGLGEVESATPFRIIPSRALENHVFVAYCNLEGPAVCAAEQGVAFFCGKSALVGPDGEDIVRAGANVGGQMLSAELRLDSYTASVNRNPYLQDRAARMREGHYDGLLQTEATAEPPAEPAGSNSPLRGSLVSLAAVDASLTGTTGEDEEVRMRRCVEGLSFSEHRYGIAHESQHLHLFLPDKGHSWLTSAAGSPVFFLLHGGFWKDKWHKYNTRTTTLVPDLLSRGFAVALVEYRRREAPGGGYPGTEEDCDAALRSLRLLPGIDLSRVVVMGHSAGAQLALAVCSRAEAASKQPPEEGGRGGEGGVVPCLCVAVAPPADMIPCHEARLSDERDAVERYLGCLPDSEAGRGVYQAASISPRRPSRVPVLLVAAGRDADVPPGLVRSFYSSWVEDVAAGEQKTVVPELLYLPLSDHYQAVTAGHPEWLSVARRTAAILQSVCGWSLPPHAPDYGVTEELGFLPKADPSTSLLSRHLTPSPAAQALFRSWEDCASQLPSLLCAGSVRKRLAALPSPEDCGSSGNSDAPPPWAEPLVADEGQAERAMLLLSFFAHAWVWGEEPVAHSLPANISRPWVEVAWVVGRPPILTYYSFNACNWRRLDPSGPVALGNTCRSLNFLGGRDEEWFSAVHVAIEAKAGAALLSSVRAQREVSSAAAAGDLRMSWGPVAAELEGIAGTVRGMLGILKRMKEGCDPYVYYTRVRIFMSGWTHDALPDGMVYEGVPTAGGGGTISGGGQWRRERYFGETGAQSSVLPALDAALGIAMEEDELTPYLRAMLGYMPPKHSEFLSALASGPPIRTLVLEAARIDTSEALRVVEAYNSCLLALAEFRGCHLELAHSFVRAFDERKDEDIRGTGGTPFMPYLRKHWRGTSRLIVPAEGARQEA